MVINIPLNQPYRVHSTIVIRSTDCASALNRFPREVYTPPLLFYTVGYKQVDERRKLKALIAVSGDERDALQFRYRGKSCVKF